MSEFPGCIILKNDPTYIRGIPDITILYKSKWACLEVKKSLADRKKPRPLQEYYVELLNKMSFSAFVYPENEEVVLNGLKRHFRVEGS